MAPKFFAKPSDFRNWLEKNHDQKPELLVGFYKVGSGKPSITWSQSVDEALCFGWIDGVRRSIAPGQLLHSVYTTKAKQYLECGKHQKNSRAQTSRAHEAKWTGCF